MKKFSRVFGFFFLLLSCIWAGDISGNWQGTIAVKDEATGTVFTTPVQIQIQQQDSTFSGKIGRAQDSDLSPIKNAKINGNVIYFEAASDETSGPCKFTLTIKGDSMEGDMTGAVENEDITGKVKVTRSHG